MQFLYEEELSDYFWKLYGRRKSVFSYQFETARRGGCDLVTLEVVGNKYQFCAFEFKLSDIKKGLTQAIHNLKYVHKSFLVVPSDKENIIRKKYYLEIRRHQYLGVITVEKDGRWKMIIKPKCQPDELICLNQDLLHLFMLGS